MWCIVNLPNGTQQAVKWDSKAIGQECLEKVCKALDIVCETEYFGLEYWAPNQEESRTRQWINLRNRLTCDSSSNFHLMLALRVKFWVPVHFLLQESVRNIFYMQAKTDLLENRLKARDWTNAAKLAALICQADGMQFNELSLKSKFPIQMKKPNNLNQQQQEEGKKHKEHVLSFKKRRLSKQKSIESIESSHLHLSTNVMSQAAQHSIEEGPPHKTNSCSSSPPYNESSDIAEYQLGNSPLDIYQQYLIYPEKNPEGNIPEDFLHQIAVEHGKLNALRMTPKSAKYWLLKLIQDLNGYGEELFSGFTANENSLRCDVAVGTNAITTCIADETNVIPFNAIAAAKSFRRAFKLEYMGDCGNRCELELKLPKHAVAAGLYRSITERHAFYVCDKVRGVVTNQFTRDLKGTIASMFKEDTELGKRYVFDIQRTCREVHDQARRVLRDKGIEVTTYSTGNDILEDMIIGTSRANYSNSLLSVQHDSKNEDNKINISEGFIMKEICSASEKLDEAFREKEKREAVIARCVETRVSEAMTCKICMDREINTMFNPCCHVTTCAECASRCVHCPNCRVKVANIVKIYLPPELRINSSLSAVSCNVEV